MNEQQQLIPLGTGERLRREREKRNLSVEDMAGALRIPVDVLTAIEADELDRFAAVYRRGYVQTYARHLGFDDEETERLLEGINLQTPELHTVFPRAARQNQADRWLRATSYVLASLLIGTLAWQFTHEAVRLSQRNTAVPGMEQPAAIDQAAQDQVSGRPATHVNASIAALENMRQQRQAGGGSAGDQAWSAMQQATNADLEAPLLPAGEHLLSVSTSADSWVEIVDAQGRQLELDLVRGGSDKQYSGSAPFRILFGRASAVELFIDGRLVDTGPFTSGDVTQMTLDESSETGDSRPDSAGGG